MKRLLHLGLLLTASAAHVFAAAIIPVSAPTRSGTSGAGHSLAPIISGDGQHVVFVSHANNLVTNDDNKPWLDVFLHDLSISNTVLVSVDASGTGGANADANYPAISGNGQFVAFASAAGNLVPGDTNNASDVFVRDVGSGETRLVSVALSGSTPIDPTPIRNVPLSGYPLISADGRWVFFESRATNLTANSTMAGGVNIYRRDTLANTTALVTYDTNSLAVADNCRLEAITPDGRYVIFTTTNHSLVAGDTHTGIDVYLRDMQTGEIIQCSANGSILVSGDYDISSPAVSSDGNSVAYNITALSSGFTYPALWERQSGTSRRLFTFAVSNAPPVISADGSAVAFEGSSNALTQILLWERASNAVRVAHQKLLGNYPEYASHVLALSSNGQYMIFREWGVDAPYFAPNHVFAYHLFRKDLSAGTLDLLSANTNGTWSLGTFHLAAVSASPDGQTVAFNSAVTDLAALDYNGYSDVFVRDVSAGMTQMISIERSGREAATPQTYSFFGKNSVSADGRYVVSLRYDDPSTPGDTNGWTDVYVSDVLSNTTVAVSLGVGQNTNAYENPIISADGTTIYAVRRGMDFQRRASVVMARSVNGAFAPGLATAVGPGNGNTYSPSTSSNGNLLVVTTTSTDLVDGVNDGNGDPDVVLVERILQTNGLYTTSNRLISISMSGEAANGVSSNGFVSPNGRWVIFESTASNLTTNETTAGAVALYARDLQENRTYSLSAKGTFASPSGYTSATAVMSGNSRYVAFFTYYTFSSLHLVIHDLTMHTNFVAPDSTGNSAFLSYDGRYATYALTEPFSNSPYRVRVRDLQNGNTEDITTVNYFVARNSPISDDGRYVVFENRFTNALGNKYWTLFVRDRVSGITLPLSTTPSGLTGNSLSSRAVMAADGRTVFFQSFATDLVGHDYNDRSDIFVVKLGGVDSDGDGMDDDWEVAYFGDKSRDGSGDFDHDGASDLAEYQAGTDPKNDGSIFRVISITPVGGGNRQLVWSGNPARNYRAEYKDDLGAATWTAIPGTVSWNGSVASITDTTAGSSAHRYYRAVIVP